ncbi:hypothetical protein MASR2M17_04510 [Aminivibrio sp.]
MSKTYRITVDGTAYTVEVEDPPEAPPLSAPFPPPPLRRLPPGPRSSPRPGSRSCSSTGTSPGSCSCGGTGSLGGTPVTAPMPGKVLRVVVAAGEAVKEGPRPHPRGHEDGNEIFSRRGSGPGRAGP